MARDLAQFDDSRAWTLREARESGKFDRHGRRPHLRQVSQWAKRGLRPFPGGPVIVLPSIRSGRNRLTMPEWVDYFVKARQAALAEQARAELDLSGLALKNGKRHQADSGDPPGGTRLRKAGTRG